MANLILVEGPDNTGKTTYIDHLVKHHGCVKIDFPKKVSNGLRFTIESPSEVACFETMLDHLPKDKCFVLDRGYISNIVYESFRGKSPRAYYEDFNRLQMNHNVLVVPFTRNPVDSDFKDDLINLRSSEFNKIIGMFAETYAKLGYEQIKNILHTPENEVITSMVPGYVDTQINLELFLERALERN